MPVNRRWVLLFIPVVLLTILGCGALATPPQQEAAVTRTLVPTFTPTPEQPTNTPEPTAPPEVQAPLPVDTPVPTEAPPSPTPAPAAKAVVNTTTMNVRSGPGTNYPITGRVTRGTSFDITGRNAAGDWWQVCCVNNQNGWVVGRLVNISGSTDGVEVVGDVSPPPVPTPAPTRAVVPTRPRPTSAPTSPPPPPVTGIFSQAGTEQRDADDANFNLVTFWGRLGRTGEQPITGGYRLRVSAPSGTNEASFGNVWEIAYSGYGTAEFRYNAKIELPRTAGSYRAVVIDGSGQEVSDPITGNLNDRTHDVILTWVRR